MLDQRILDAFATENGFDLTDALVMSCVVGSLSHGTHDPRPDSIDDVDYMLVVMPPRERLLGLHKWSHWRMQQDELDVVAYSFERYVGLLLKANPNVVGTLWLRPVDYQYQHAAFKELVARRDMFSSLRAADSFGGYAYGQLRRMENLACEGYMGAKRKALVQQFGYDTKNAAHTIRLFRMGIEFVATGQMQVWREDADELKAIKRGEWSLDRIRSEAKRLDTLLTEASATSPLPKQPDTEAADRLLVHWSTGRVIADEKQSRFTTLRDNIKQRLAAT